MNKLTTSTAIPTRALKLEALSKISASFELFCLASGMEALGEMMDRDAQAICGPRHARGRDRRAHRWGKTKGKIGFHGGKVEIERPRLRGFDGKEQPVPSWEAAVAENWLGKWAMNQMLINVATRKFARSVRLPFFPTDAPAAGDRAHGGPQIACASSSIISRRASRPEARQNDSKLAEMFDSASSFSALVGIAVDVVNLFMALLSFVESAPRSLSAQGGQRRFSYINIVRDNSLQGREMLFGFGEIALH